MAKVGVCKPYYAIYDTSAKTYSDGGVLAKATSVSIEIDSSSDNILYADNEPAEKASAFAGGTLTVGVDELGLTEMAALFGITAESITEPVTASVLKFNSQVAPYIGFGIVIKRIKSGVTKWTAVILPKVQFSIPNDEADTQEDEIDWQTTELEATIFRDNSANEDWKYVAECASQADAETYIKSVLSITRFSEKKG